MFTRKNLFRLLALLVAAALIGAVMICMGGSSDDAPQEEQSQPTTTTAPATCDESAFVHGDFDFLKHHGLSIYGQIMVNEGCDKRSATIQFQQSQTRNDPAWDDFHTHLEGVLGEEFYGNSNPRGTCTEVSFALLPGQTLDDVMTVGKQLADYLHTKHLCPVYQTGGS